MTKKGIKLFKIGGSILDSGREIKKLIDCLKKKIEPGKAILVHGGGSAITRWLDAFGVEVEFVNGQRVTDEKSMKVVEMVLSGLINKKLVSILNRAGYRAIGISGRDAGIATAKILDKKLGKVGEVSKVNKEVLISLLSKKIVPVISPVCSSKNGEAINVNADFFAAELASRMKAEELNLVTSVGGVLKKDKLIKSLTCDEIPALFKGKIAFGGMIPKLQASVKAREKGVERVNILSYEGKIGTCIL